jgi:hypothetical protein
LRGWILGDVLRVVVIRDPERDRVPFDVGDFATGKLFNILVYCCILWITLAEGADDNVVARAYMVKQCTVVATRIAAVDVLLSVGIQVCSFPDWALSRSVSAILVSHFHWCPSEFRLCAIDRKEEHSSHVRRRTLTSFTKLLADQTMNLPIVLLVCTRAVVDIIASRT